MAAERCSLELNSGPAAAVSNASGCDAGYRPRLILFIGCAFLLTMQPVASLAQQCGPPNLGVVTCNNAASNPYAGGISYSTATGITVNVGGGIVVDRTPGANNKGIYVLGTGANLLKVEVAKGASISTEGSLANGLQVQANGNSSIEITSGATIAVSIPGMANPGVGTNGVVGWITSNTGLGHISIKQTEDSAIAIEGFEGNGLYGLHQGRGGVSIETSGAISTAGQASTGVTAWNLNTLSTGDVVTSQGVGGTIVTNGNESVGLYSLTDGLGAARASVAGEIKTQQFSSDGVLAYITNGLSQANVTVGLADTGSIITEGNASRGAWGYNSGLGQVDIQSAGSITTLGDSSAGIVSLSDNAANTATDTVRVLGNAQVRTMGTRSHAVLANHSGVGIINIDLLDTTKLSTTGALANGVDTRSGGAIALRLGASAAITVTGAESYGIRADASASTAGIAVDGAIAASGKFGVGVSAQSTLGNARVDVAAGATINGGWQADIASVGATTTRPSAGVMLRSATESVLVNAGVIGAASDRAVADAGRYLAPLGHVRIQNTNTITGFVELAPVASNSFTNANGGLFDVRHFADTDGNGVRDTKRVSLSNFGLASSRFDNQLGALVRLATVTGAAATDTTSYYVPTTGDLGRALEGTFYTLSREGIVQGQFTNLGSFTNAGVIDLRGPAIGNTLVMTGNAAAGGAPGNGVFVSDGGQLLLNTVLNAGVGPGGQTNSYSDVLIVDSTMLASAPTTISVDRREGPGALTTGNGILLVEVRNKAASADSVFVLSGDYVAEGQQRLLRGPFSYGLYHNGLAADVADGNWYLRNDGFSPNVPVYEDTPNTLRALVDPSSLKQRIGNRLWLAPTPAPTEPVTVFCKDPKSNFRCTLTDEQADYYVSEATQSIDGSGAWGRVVGLQGHYEPDFSTASTGYDVTHTGLQAGIDHLLMENNAGKLVGGVYGQYGHVSGKSGTGALAAGGFGAGGTLTYYNNGGFYVDGQAQTLWYTGDYSSDLFGRLAHDATGIAYGFSLEAGQRIALTDSWSVTPQAQLSYSNIRLNPFSDAFGATVEIDQAGNLQGRLGLAVEHQQRWKAADGTTSRLDTHGILNLQSNFSDANRVLVSGVVLESKRDPVWLSAGLGSTFNWNDDHSSVFGELAAGTSLANFASSYELKGSVGLRVKW